MSLKSILRTDEAALVKCYPTDFIDEAIALMIDANRNAVVVMGAGSEIAGILTDHDIIRAVHDAQTKGGSITTQSVTDWMTSDVISCPVEAKLTDALKLMGRHKIRHLLVKDGDVAKAIVSIRDVLSQIHQNDELEAEVLRDMARATRGIVSA